jgi:hypothetical protein
MNLLDRLLAHDAWTTRQLLDRCRALARALADDQPVRRCPSVRRPISSGLGAFARIVRLS